MRMQVSLLIYDAKKTHMQSDRGLWAHTRALLPTDNTAHQPQLRLKSMLRWGRESHRPPKSGEVVCVQHSKHALHLGQ